jgi:hypothetical protein
MCGSKECLGAPSISPEVGGNPEDRSEVKEMIFFGQAFCP